ncbi:MAG: D-tyrosyl-tRNA(Tyr) deacylase [Phycisphaerae bacterium]|nr:D-tyrosyl-tRNA(Tyr) deacylase [Phycisphaerae bacterium]
MRAVVQRVSSAAVVVEGQCTGRIGSGLLVYLAVDAEDDEKDLFYLVDKVRYLRVFEDSAGKMNRDVCEFGGAVLAVSAFSVRGDARKGRRPSYSHAAAPQKASEMYDRFCTDLADTGIEVQRGVFRAYMKVSSINDGPICILLDSKRAF